ncbi:MAG: YIP1 family protein [Anaerolineae bacterium]|nr:YIP1 family protein [Anaerolineae bacterium]
MRNQASSERRGLLRLLVGIILRPRATFQYLAGEGRWRWWIPALLAAVMVVMPIVVATPINTRQALEALKTTQEMLNQQTLSPEQQQQMEQAQKMVTSPLFITVFPSITAVLGLAVGWLAWAGALYLIGIVIGGPASFGDLFRMVVWAWIPYTLRGFLQTLYILLAGQTIAHPGLSGLVASPQGVKEMLTAPPTMGQMVVLALLSRIDLFLFWNLALLVVGTIVVTRLSPRKAAALVLGIWVLFTLMGLIPTLISSLFMGQVTTVGG